MRSGSERTARPAARAAAIGTLAGAMAMATAAGAVNGTDATYGRLQGDASLVVGAGGTVANGGLRGEGELRLRYLETAGVFASYEDGPLLSSGAEPRRVFATGLELRPLFLFRWLKGHEASRAALDLLIDSLGFELGAVFEQPSGTSFESRPGLQLGGMLEVPLLGTATGPWLAVHAGVRWSDRALSATSMAGPDDQSFYLSFTLAWHQGVLIHAVDAGDKSPR